ncbi:unnamed protein product [Amoebophrya sp. A25]|nr:unnamed protein product [Amoebophrya sp. A25]|eukprot:GSA25T00012438001.1
MSVGIVSVLAPRSGAARLRVVPSCAMIPHRDAHAAQQPLALRSWVPATSSASDFGSRRMSFSSASVTLAKEGSTLLGRRSNRRSTLLPCPPRIQAASYSSSSAAAIDLDASKTAQEDTSNIKASSNSAARATSTTSSPSTTASSIGSPEDPSASETSSERNEVSAKKKKGYFRRLIEEYGLPFLVWYESVWTVTGLATYYALWADYITWSQTVEWIEWGFTAVLPLQDYLPDLAAIDPTTGQIAVAFVLNECIEPVRLPFVLLTLPFVRPGLVRLIAKWKPPLMNVWNRLIARGQSVLNRMKMGAKQT